jgi:hypothetical protein
MPDPHTFKTTVQFKGKTTSVSTYTLCSDGNSISDVTVNTREDGSTYTTTETDTRTGPGEGFAGTWTSTKASNTSDNPHTITATDDSITFSNPAEKSTLTAKLDGTPAVPVSPAMTAGITVSYKKVSPTRLEFSVMLNGKKISQGFDELSADGTSYSDVNWLLGKESEKTTKIYAKQ